MNATYVIKGDRSGYWVRLVAGNGQIVIWTEKYTTRVMARQAVAWLQTNTGTAARYTFHAATNGGHYFRISGTNGEQVARSEIYSTAANSRDAAAWVQRNGPGAGYRDDAA